MSGPPLSSDPRDGVVTPEAVLLEFEVAGLGSRTAAELLDIALQAVMLLVIAFAAVGAGRAGGGAGAAVIGIPSAFLVIVGYPMAIESLWGGRTLGKAAMGLRVVTVEGGPERFRHAALRAIIGVFEIYFTLGSFAVLSMILTRRSQRLGDLAAGTIVRRERVSAGNEAVAVTFTPPYGCEAYVAALDVSALDNDQYGLVRTFLMRTPQLTPGARGALGVRLANQVARHLRATPPPGLGPEHFLVCVAAAYQRRYGAPLPPPPQVPPPPVPPPPLGWRPS